MYKVMNLVLAMSLMLLMVSCGGETASDQQTDAEIETAVEHEADVEVGQQAGQQVSPQTTQPGTQQSTPPATPKPKAPVYVVMPESTAITVTLIDSIDTDIHVSGQEFRGALSHPIVAEGQVLFAAGAPVMGVLDSVVESGRLKTPAEVHFSVRSIQDARGNWVDVPTNLISDKKASHTDRQVAMIGGGAIVGGIIGKVIDKKGSTEIGAAAGAAVGTGLSAATGKQDIFYGVGSEIVFFSKQPVRVEIK